MLCGASQQHSSTMHPGKSGMISVLSLWVCAAL
jgi:hypothetical protein